MSLPESVLALSCVFACGLAVAGPAEPADPAATSAATATTPVTALAATPQPSATPDLGLAPAAAPVAMAATGASADAAKTPTAVNVDAQTKRLRAAGYKPVTVNGKTFFCREEAPLGSRLTRKVCGTPEDLDAAAKAGQEATDDIRRRSNSGPRSN